MIRIRVLLFLMCVSAALCIRCVPNSGAGGSSSEVNGRLCDVAGNPVEGAIVYLDTVKNFDSSAILDTAAVHRYNSTSNADGNYTITVSENGNVAYNGVYNINSYAKNGALVAYQSGVVVNRPPDFTGVFTVSVDPLTMRPPGSITGKVVINSNSPVTCYIPGTSFLATSNDTGGFTISNIPAGVYSVYYYQSGYKTDSVTSVTVIAGEPTKIPTKVLSIDPSATLPPPVGVTAITDSGKGIVHLSWRSVPVGDLAGYHVFRTFDGSALVQITKALISDTVYVDTVFKSTSDTITRTYTYQIKVFDTDSNKSDYSKAFEITATIIKPPAVDVNAIKGTDSSVTVTWRKFTGNEFSQYRLFWSDTGKGAVAAVVKDSITKIQDTSYTIKTWKNGFKRFSVNVISEVGLCSSPGATAVGAIVNSAPRITTDTAKIAKTANVKVLYRVGFSVVDANRDSLFFSLLSSPPGLTVKDSAIEWTPVVTDTGLHRISVQVRDVFGGFDTISWNVNVSPVNAFSSMPPLIKARSFHSAVVLGDMLYAIGGGATPYYGGFLTIQANSFIESFSLASEGSWINATNSLVLPLPAPRYKMACALLGNKIFCFGGLDKNNSYIMSVDSFTPAAKTWKKADSLISSRAGAAVCSYNNKLYLIGGQCLSDYGSTILSRIDQWDPENGWVSKAPMTIARRDHQAIVWNKKIYIIGGYGGSSEPDECEPQSSVEVYDPDLDEIVNAASPKSARMNFGAAEANGKIYVFGGQGTESVLASVEEYDPEKDTWTDKGNLPNSRYGCAAASWKGNIYIVGGVENGATKETNSVLKYYP
jgi:hypothetical protein